MDLVGTLHLAKSQTGLSFASSIFLLFSRPAISPGSKIFDYQPIGKPRFSHHTTKLRISPRLDRGPAL